MMQGLAPWRRGDVIAATLAINCLGLALPLAILHIYDRVLREASLATLTYLAVITAGALGLEGALRVLRAHVISHLAARFEHRTALRVFSAMMDARTAQGDSDSAATLQRLRDISFVREFYYGPPMLTALDLPFSVAAFGLIAYIAGPLTLVPIVMVGVMIVAILAVARPLTRTLLDQQSTDTSRVRFVYEMLRGVHTVKALSLESQLRRRHEELQAASARNVERVTQLTGAAQALTSSVAFSTTSIVVVAGASLAVSGSLTIGALAATSMLAGRMIQPIARVAASWSRYYAVRQSETDLAALLNRDTTIDRPARSKDTPPITGHLALVNATITPPGGRPPILERVNLMAPAGSITGIVGPPGSGKSVLMSALAGERPLDAGELSVDGAAMTPATLEAYRAQVRLVTAEMALFSGTLMQNVTMHRDGAFRQNAIEALHDVGLSRAIARLPDGVNSLIDGAENTTFPPGVAQRIMVARALVSAPKVLLLDTSNDALDYESDHHLLNFIANLRGAVTVVMVSERPSYLRICDAVYEIANKQLVRRSAPDAAAPPASVAAKGGVA